MAARKSGGKVIEHDPLAWLGNDNETDQKEAGYGFFDSDSSVSTDLDGVKSDSRGAVLSLGDALTVKNVAECKKQITEYLARNSEITLESADLQKVDTAGLQLLFSLQKSLAISQQRIIWKDANPVIESASRLTGLIDIIEGASSTRRLNTDAQQKPQTQSPADQGFGFF